MYDRNTDDSIGAEDGEREPIGGDGWHVPVTSEVHNLLRLGGAERVDLVLELPVDSVIRTPAKSADSQEVDNDGGNTQGCEAIRHSCGAGEVPKVNHTTRRLYIQELEQPRELIWKETYFIRDRGTGGDETHPSRCGYM
jgi:hypothetical protein